MERNPEPGNLWMVSHEPQIPLAASARADQPESERGAHHILPDLSYRRLGIVNVGFIGVPGQTNWWLVDAGLPMTAGLIEGAADGLFLGARPQAILLTHGHFDHVGALDALLRRWNVPVYAHESELPYLDGREAYPAPDPSVGGGLLAALSPLYPRGPIDVSEWLEPLPENGMVPELPDWQWIPTPGHSPGHVSFWRESDRTLIAGDAFVTVRQESIYAAATQEVEMHGPPQYFTPDWPSAKSSVATIAGLEPEVCLCGHGRPMQGPELRRALHALADRFDEVAVPHGARYAL